LSDFFNFLFLKKNFSLKQKKLTVKAFFSAALKRVFFYLIFAEFSKWAVRKLVTF